MPTGGEADYANALRVKAPLASLAAHQADCPLGILEWPPCRLPLHVIGSPRHPVLQDDAGDAARVQPGSDLLAFQLPVQIPVAGSGADQDRRADVLVLGR